ncbi:MAG: glycosyltransferase family 39 protein [Verrucomicrobia bacterium]|nr:glycosyltransferase family 39 protein [Verrucomicrobiota bacterium]
MTNRPDTSTAHPPRPAGGWVLLGLATLALFIVRVTGPSNLLDNDQERPAAYVMDAVLHGRWWCQTDWTGAIMSKPPLFTWLAALATIPVGHANLASLYFPCLVAVGLTVGLIFGFGRGRFGWAAGFLAALLYLASPSGVKHIALARTDALFAATIALTALLGYRAWTRGRGWFWFWLAAALATLTKGPLGVVLGATGLLAILWEHWSAGQAARAGAASVPSPRASGRCGRSSVADHLGGLVLFFGITAGWFWLAYRQGGQPFIDKVIGRELVGHVVSNEHGVFGAGLVKAPLYWLSRFLPWSLLAMMGLWRVVKRPATVPEERRFERFLFCWIVGGLGVFALATHQRGDLPLPLNAPAALLAGRELVRWLNRWEPARLVRRSLGAVTAALALYALYLHTGFANTWEVRQSEAVEAFAQQLSRQPSLPRLLHVDSPYALQFHLNAMDRLVSLDTAAAELKSGSPCAVAVQDAARLQDALGDAVTLYEWGNCPGSKEGSSVTVLSNRPRSPGW